MLQNREINLDLTRFHQKSHSVFLSQTLSHTEAPQRPSVVLNPLWPQRSSLTSPQLHLCLPAVALIIPLPLSAKSCRHVPPPLPAAASCPESASWHHHAAAATSCAVTLRRPAELAALNRVCVYMTFGFRAVGYYIVMFFFLYQTDIFDIVNITIALN